MRRNDLKLLCSLNQAVMNKDKYVFAQLVGFLDNFKFLRIVKKYEGDKYIKSYTCWNQLLTMMFGQLSNRESLRDLIVAMEAHAGKLYHLGIGKSVTRSILTRLTSSATTAYSRSSRPTVVMPKNKKITLPLRNDFGICRDPKIVPNTTSDTVYFTIPSS